MGKAEIATDLIGKQISVTRGSKNRSDQFYKGNYYVL